MSGKHRVPAPKAASVTDAAALITSAVSDDGLLLVLTGAGISAESGIPTFRGADGFWTIGSRNYQPMELATRSAFESMPEHVWSWYLSRRAFCHAAEPNTAHVALVELERALGDRFLLITQNVDGLHRRAGSSESRTYQIHGCLDLIRCSEECTSAVFPMPEALGTTWDVGSDGRELTTRELSLLRCPICGALARPHVLWFDEYYDEERFRFQSSLLAADKAAALLVIGTSGATNLPIQIGERVAERQTSMIVVNPEPNPFSELAANVPRSVFLEGGAGENIPKLVDAICREQARS
jgi:NAD-dependent deacetylase